MNFTGEIIKSIWHWINQPDFKDPEKNLAAFYIQVISLIILAAGFIIGAVYALVGQFGYVIFIAIDILILSLVIALVRFKKLQFASNLFNVSTLGLLTLGILSVGGIHALGSILYPVILIFASLLLGRRSFFIYSLLCVVSVGVIVYAENQKFTPPYVPDPPEFYVFFTFSLMLAASALFIRFITENLQNNLIKVRQAVQEVTAQKAMLDHVGQAVVGCDAENFIIYWNQAAADLYGWKAEEALGRKYYEVIPTQMSSGMLDAVRGVVRKGEVWSGEFTIRKHDQGEVPVIGTIAPLHDEHDKVTGWIGIAADLTSRQKAEQESKRRANEMTLLYRLGISLASGNNLYSTLLALQTEIFQLIQADAFYVAIYNEESDVVSYPIFFDEGKPFHEPDRLLHEWPGLTGAVIFSGKTLYLADMTTPEVERSYHPHDTNGIELYTFLGIPLISNERIIGMLSVQSKQVSAYSEEQIQLMENVAVLAASAVDKAQLLERLQLELIERKQAEEKYRTIFEQAIDGIFQSTPDGRFINVNPAMARMYGYDSPEDMIQNITNISSQLYVDSELRNSVLSRMANGEKVTGFETHEYRKDGSTLWTSMNAQAIHDANGNILYFEGTVEDITHRKMADEVVRQSEERFRTLFNGILDGVYRSSHDGRFLDVNPAMIRMFGYTNREEMLAVDIKKELYFAPEERESLFLDTGLEKVDEFRMRRKDGTEIWVEDHGHYVHDENGNVIYHEGILRDITGRKQAEIERERLIRELAAQNAESETLREGLASIVGTFEFSEIIEHILDQIGRVVPFDSASIWRLEGNVQKLIASRNLPLENPVDEMEIKVDEINSALRIIRGEVPYILNHNVQTELLDFKDPPHNIINSWLAIPLKTRGKIIGLIAIDGYRKNQFNEHHAQLAVTFANQVAIALENSRLFSELQSELFTRGQLIKELESKNTELERFTYTVSHDLKSPLVTINGFLGYLKEDAASGNSNRVTLDIQRIQDAVDKMHLLLKELLELSRIGRIMNPPERVLFEDLVREALEIVHGRLESRGVTVHSQPNLPAIQGDRQRLIEVLQNLIDNAAKYMGNQTAPHIEIGQCGEEDGKPVFYIQDNGMGIPPEHHERIFGLFDKLDPKSEGTGVGLALVKRIVEVHGGRIWLESEAGKGTTFYLTLGIVDAK